MLRKFYYKLCWIKNISLLKFIHFNYFSKHVVRDKKSFLIPYKGTRIEFGKNSKIVIKGKNLEIGINKIKGSKAETFIRLKKDAVWKCNNGCALNYNSDIEVHESALLETGGGIFINALSTIVCTKHISIGEGCLMGRNIIIYDSDYHQIQDQNGNMKNYSKSVVIGDHVWFTNQIMVLKGVHVGSGSVIAPHTVIRKSVPENCMVGNSSQAIVFQQDIYWSPERVHDRGYEK